ncbi:hypothetical protein FJY94_07670 [Candidatus Kaiserbacteria bacterium]|nr:hypothetical protein [Candidatus Kaiserbacteria bacterium]
MQKLEAQRIRHRVRVCPDYNPQIDELDLRQVDAMEQAADAMLALPCPAARGTGGELVPPLERGHTSHSLAVLEPDQVSLEASIERVALADRCGVFNLALDAAETINAGNALEQMLTHQMAAAHKMSLDLLAKAAVEHDTVELARLTNAAARLMNVYQQAMLTMNRIRTGGQQTVTVQHVNVGAGGQAVIGNVQAGGRAPGGGREDG